MHELGIVFYIIKDVKEAAQQNNVAKISSVTLKLGEVTTVIPYYLEDCWKWAIKKESNLLKDAELIIEKVPAITFCESCEKEYPTIENGKICPYCKSEKTYLLQGNEIMIKEIAVAQTSESQTSEIDNSSPSFIDSGVQASDP
ncbi:MAG: hydrogenase maturation nickel metallochaperone HypA [Treponemataceae bacterium]